MISTSSSPVRTDLSDPMTRRRVDLADEARRLSRRRASALAVAARCRALSRPIPREDAIAISARALKRATGLHVRFHRALDALVAAGGFDEALRIVRDRRSRPPSSVSH